MDDELEIALPLETEPKELRFDIGCLEWIENVDGDVDVDARELHKLVGDADTVRKCRGFNEDIEL